MIGLTGLRSPLVIGALALGVAVGGFAGWKGGHWFGYRAGAADQKAGQIVADAQADAEITERARDALSKVGASVSDADIDTILRGLAGE